jgi:hypothetical protein
VKNREGVGVIGIALLGLNYRIPIDPITPRIPKHHPGRRGRSLVNDLAPLPNLLEENNPVVTFGPVTIVHTSNVPGFKIFAPPGLFVIDSGQVARY